MHTITDVSDWCARHLGAPAGASLFETGHLSRVVGVRLTDGRTAVVKVRTGSPRIAGCTRVQAALAADGFPAPRPLTGPHPFGTGELVATAEEYLPDGQILTLDAVAASATALYNLVTHASRVSRVGPGPEPNPPWTAWDHPGTATWPPADDTDADLNDHAASAGLDAIGRGIRERLGGLSAAGRLGPDMIGHGDWEAHNLRWAGGLLYAVHDWDSLMTAPEAIIAGLAAAVWSCGATEPSRPTSIDESASFLDAYQCARGRPFRVEETIAAWAAGLWVSTFNEKKAQVAGFSWIPAADIETRASLANL